MPLTDILPYMVLAAIPAFAVGWLIGAIVGLVMMRRVFVRYLRRRHGRYAA